MRIFDYISRIGKSRGFGIQSPWAYSFVRDVITESLPYYAYDEIERLYSDPHKRKLNKLFFRLENYAGQDGFYIFYINSITASILEEYFKRIGTNGIIVIIGINKDDKSRAMWRNIQILSWIGITFDLYELAICFAPSDMYKQHYKLNF